MHYRERITIDPDMCNGKLCIQGMRITIYDILGYLASGMSREEVLEDLPHLEAEDTRASLALAANTEHVFVSDPSCAKL